MASGRSNTRIVPMYQDRDNYVMIAAAAVPMWYEIGRRETGNNLWFTRAYRDSLAKEEGVIAFEIEGAGVWEILPCIVMKSACDYADSHKMMAWQRYAAATTSTCA
ncbi:hypothetical protein PspLS_08673, partial [Pyricularia sp. CBS 133598]